MGKSNPYNWNSWDDVPKNELIVQVNTHLEPREGFSRDVPQASYRDDRKVMIDALVQFGISFEYIKEDAIETYETWKRYKLEKVL